jgi:hypothetical protein
LVVVVMMMMMSMGWDYVSELRPPTGLLFVPQVIYEYGEPRWNEIDRRKLQIHPPDLCGNHTHNLVAKQEELTKELMNFALQRISFVLRRVL